MDLLECPICEFLMCEPVTVSCGHSFCRRCVGTNLPSRCPACKDKLKLRDVKNIKNNVLLFSVIEKCCPEEVKLKCHLQESLKAGEFTQALRVADEGMEIAPDDLSLKLWRAEACAGLRRFADALQDLDDLCHERPTWPEGFFRKGNMLLEMGRQTDALFQYHGCLKLQADFLPARIQIKKILESEGMMVPEEIPRLLQVVSDYLSDPCPITSSVGPSHGEGPRLSPDEDGDGNGQREKRLCKTKHTTSAECCLSLCQAVSFLPSGEEDEELMTRKEEQRTRGRCGQGREMSLNMLTVSDFECPLCIRLFYEPVTTPCGHTFCKNCIERSLDHNLRCPLCKQPLHEYLKNRKYNLTVLLQEVMTHLFPQQLEERKQVHEAEIAELSNLTKDIPIFVCTVACPGISCPLHIFEPRYRLMMRRCMETGTKKFGMCTYESGKGFADYGCMLEILGLDLLPDGRSYVDTVGGSRFRVLKRGQRDGYHTADIEYLEDQKVEGQELEMLKRLHDSVYQQAREWYHHLSGRIQDQISRQYGPMPDREENIQVSDVQVSPLVSSSPPLVSSPRFLHILPGMPELCGGKEGRKRVEERRKGGDESKVGTANPIRPSSKLTSAIDEVIISNDSEDTKANHASLTPPALDVTQKCEKTSAETKKEERRRRDCALEQWRKGGHIISFGHGGKEGRKGGDEFEYWNAAKASSNGPAWCWWLLSVLQLDPAYQTTVLSLTSLKDRLGHLRIVLEYFSQS
ncbi:hypothetical protein JZ751_007097 [Albula glossodonta]|uniref:LON peptidase N-terminal domain and ring finger 1 n=1 Tax=Albula glossodonta TaxID=121402 RepID=A0A8T2P391_9TELE|nr:hypothetical protein JZ751_007097 [Albula glossodonta]